MIAASTGWTAGSYLITSVSAGSAIVGTAPAADGTTGGLWGTADPHIYQFTWAPAISYWTSNPIAIVEVMTSNMDSPLTFTTKQTTPFRYAERGFVVEPISGNLGGDYTIEPGSGKLTFRDAPDLEQIILVEYFPDQPVKLPRRKPGDLPPHTARFVIVNDTRPFTIVLTSTDATTWATRTTPLTKNGIAVAYGAGVYVMGCNLTSETQQIATSTDAVTWTARSTPSDSKAIRDIIFGGGKFVSIYNSSTTPIMTSTDGIAWTAHAVPTPAPSGGWQRLAYSSTLGLYVAICPTGPIMTSTDAVTWTDTGSPVTFSDLACIAWGTGLFVLLGGTEGSGLHLHTSPDGITWTLQSDPAGAAHRYEGVCFGGGKFVAVSPNGFAASSSDGLTWTQGTGVPSDTWQAVTFGAGKYVACANGSSDTSSAMTSTDAVAWTAQTTPSVDSCEAITYG